MAFVFSNKVLEKLAQKHGVNKDEVEQCFANRTGEYLEDDREEHQTDPATQWFVAETNYGRLLKIIFIAKNNSLYIRSAYPPSDEVIRIYKKYSEEIE